MKVLLICSVLQDGIGQYFGKNEQYLGGWIEGIVKGLANYPDITLSYVVFEQGNHDDLQMHSVRGIDYYVVTFKSTAPIHEFFSKNQYDIYHLFGAEHSYIKYICRELPMERTLVYIQGLISEYYWHFYANYNQYFKSYNPFFKGYLKISAEIFRKNGLVEQEIIRNAKYITGRTDWDRAVLYKADCKAIYYPLNETLRSEFYSAGKWKPDHMKRHTIFVSQTNYPIKCAHMIVEMLRILKPHYSDLECLIAGYDLMKTTSLTSRLGISYACYIRKLIRDCHLEDTIHFIGNQPASEMIHRLQESNVFLLASSVENSPNSLQEAMEIGTPCVSSYVGGVSTLVGDSGGCLLYPYDDPAQGAYMISRIFEDDNLAEALSEKAVNRIDRLIDRERNARTLHEIYCDMGWRIRSTQK